MPRGEKWLKILTIFVISHRVLRLRTHRLDRMKTMTKLNVMSCQIFIFCPSGASIKWMYWTFVPQVILSSAFIPLFSGWMPPKVGGARFMDGCYSDNLPILDENTITVSPFCGGSKPKNQNRCHFFKFKKIKISVFQIIFYRIRHLSERSDRKSNAGLIWEFPGNI